MNAERSARLLTAVSLGLSACAASAETYFCEDVAGVSIDQYGVSTSTDEVNDFEDQEWVVDTEKGWRRADLPHFSGACESNKGYVVCKAHDIAFGEATFSIHPNGSDYVLVYIDYGLDALAFAGKCSRT